MEPEKKKKEESVGIIKGKVELDCQRTKTK